MKKLLLNIFTAITFSSLFCPEKKLLTMTNYYILVYRGKGTGSMYNSKNPSNLNKLITEKQDCNFSCETAISPEVFTEFDEHELIIAKPTYNFSCEIAIPRKDSSEIINKIEQQKNVLILSPGVISLFFINLIKNTPQFLTTIKVNGNKVRAIIYPSPSTTFASQEKEITTTVNINEENDLLLINKDTTKIFINLAINNTIFQTLIIFIYGLKTKILEKVDYLEVREINLSNEGTYYFIQAIKGGIFDPIEKVCFKNCTLRLNVKPQERVKEEEEKDIRVMAEQHDCIFEFFKKKATQKMKVTMEFPKRNKWINRTIYTFNHDGNGSVCHEDQLPYQETTTTPTPHKKPKRRRDRREKT